MAFADLNGRQTAWTGDRTEFLGRDGALERPLASDCLEQFCPIVSARGSIRAVRCKRKSGWPPAVTTEIVFFLGQARERDGASGA